MVGRLSLGNRQGMALLLQARHMHRAHRRLRRRLRILRLKAKRLNRIRLALSSTDISSTGNHGRLQHRSQLGGLPAIALPLLLLLRLLLLRHHHQLRHLHFLNSRRRLPRLRNHTSIRIIGTLMMFLFN